MQLSENELVTLLLCSDLAVGDVSPLSDSAYSAFATALYKENRQPSDLFSMSSENIAEIYQKYRQQLFSRCRTCDFDTRIPYLLKRHQQLTIELSDLNDRGISVVTRANRDLYPQKLRKKFCKSKIPLPPVIFYSGNLGLIETNKSISVVGSRDLKKDKTAELFTRNFVFSAIDDGFSVSSGGAKGIDQIAFESSLSKGGHSIIAVSDSMIKRICEPMVRKAIMAGDSLWLSIVNPKEKFKSYNAMARNKIIYAVSDYAMVVTCEYHTSVKNGKEVINNNKGGTWVGAHECADKELSRLMVRSSPNAPKGNNELLNTLDCINIEESKILLGSSVSDLIDKNVSVGYQYRKYGEGNIFSFL